MSAERDLSEEVAKQALTMPSALTPAYKATLDAVDLLHAGRPQRAAGRLRDAALLAEREEDAEAFRRFADRAGDL